MSNSMGQKDGIVGNGTQYSQLPTDDQRSLEISSSMDAGSKTPSSVKKGDYRVEVVAHHRGHPIYSDMKTQWEFVESDWFRAIVISVFLASTIMLVLELGDGDLAGALMIPNLCITGLISFELWAKFIYYGSHFLYDRWVFVAFRFLDLLLVLLAVADNLLTFRPLNVEDSPMAGKLVILVRFCRLLQIVKMLNIVLDYDLSWSEAAWFQSFIGVVIGFNSMLMGLETDVESPIWDPIEQLLLTVYTAELLVRLKKQGVLDFMSYENHDFVWNWLDLVIVVSSAADSWGLGLMKLVTNAMRQSEVDAGMEQGHKKKGMNLSQVMMLMRMMRLLRILRLVKLVKAVKPLYILVMGVSSAVQGVFWVLVLTIVTLYAMSIVATRLIGHGLVFEGHERPADEDLAVFGTVPDSMFTLFRVMSGAQSEEESDKMEVLMNERPSMKFAFVFFMVTGSWTLLSILTAVVSEKMIFTCNEEQAEMKMLSYEEDRAKHMEELKKLFMTLDRDHSGALELRELDPVLQDPMMAAKIAHICRVPVRNVRDCFHTLSRNGEKCPLDLFVASMLEVAKPATEQSVMKILAQVLDAQHEVERTRHSHEEQIEGLLQVVRDAEQKHHDIMMEMEEKNAEQEQKHAEAILEMEQKNAAQEQRHAEAVMHLVQKNSQTITAVLEVVNALALRQENFEKTRIEADSSLGVRLQGMERANNEALTALQRKIASIHAGCQRSAVNGTSIAADDKIREHASTDIREPQLACSD